MNKVVFVAAKRTPIGKMGGALSSFSAVDLGTIAVHAALQQSTVDPSTVGEVFFGNVLTAGEGQNPARQVALKAGISQTVPATTVNDVCGSGMQAIRLGADQIQLGRADVIVAGGMESMSNAPYLIPKGRFGYRFGDAKLVDSLDHDGLRDASGDYPMGITAENLLKKFPHSRQEIDQFALSSQQKASQAIQTGRFKEEIVPIPVTDRHHESHVVSQDEPVRHTSLAQLARLKPSFKADGEVTAGNSSGINDGAAAVVMTSEDYAESHNLTILGYWTDHAIVGVDPAIMGIGPYFAIQKLLTQQQITLDDVDLFEINEAFAAQSLIVVDQLGLDPAKVNVNGGAVALGHPLGASGARIIVTLLYEMRRRQVRQGIASLCIGGGMGAATLITQ